METKKLVELLAQEIDVALKRLGFWRDYFYGVGFSRDTIDFPNHSSYSSIALILLRAIEIRDQINNDQTGKAVSDFVIIAQGQVIVDGILHLIAEHLEGKQALFFRQRQNREQIQLLLNNERDSVSRNNWVEKLSVEKDISDTIVFWKNLFHSISEKAKGLGFEIFEREAELFKIYCTLEVSIREIVEELQRQAVAAKANFNNKKLPLPAAYLHFG